VLSILKTYPHLRGSFTVLLRIYPQFELKVRIRSTSHIVTGGMGAVTWIAGWTSREASEARRKRSAARHCWPRSPKALIIAGRRVDDLAPRDVSLRTHLARLCLEAAARRYAELTEYLMQRRLRLPGSEPDETIDDAD